MRMAVFVAMAMIVVVQVIVVVLVVYGIKLARDAIYNNFVRPPFSIFVILAGSTCG
jgi:hypothetical protein